MSSPDMPRPEQSKDLPDITGRAAEFAESVSDFSSRGDLSTLNQEQLSRFQAAVFEAFAQGRERILEEVCERIKDFIGKKPGVKIHHFVKNDRVLEASFRIEADFSELDNEREKAMADGIVADIQEAYPTIKVKRIDDSRLNIIVTNKKPH